MAKHSTVSLRQSSLVRTGGQHRGDAARKSAREKRARARGTAKTRSGDDDVLVIPTMTVDLGRVMAKLLNAGAPPTSAVGYIVPGIDPDSARRLARNWMSSPHVLAGVAELNGGAWESLSNARRFEIAHDKSTCEAAFYLYTHNFNDAQPGKFGDLDKYKMAREIVRAELKGDTDDDDPMQAMQRMLTDLVSKQAQPPQMYPVLPGTSAPSAGQKKRVAES